MPVRHKYTWRATLKFLRKNFPITNKVIVRRIAKKTSECNLYFTNGIIHIYISTKQSLDGQIDSIMHEWAHARAIEEACKHEGTWSEHFGKIYEKWELWNESGV